MTAYSAPTRLCPQCGKSRPIKGGRMTQTGRFLWCAECKPKPKPKADDPLGDPSNFCDGDEPWELP